MVRKQRTTSIGSVRSTTHWWCHCGPMCANVCHRLSPTTEPWHLYRRTCTGNHRVIRWRCSNIRCVLCGWFWACNWSSSTLWRYDPSHRIRWLDCCGSVRNERMTPNRNDLHRGLCICIRPRCSIAWWSCPESRIRFDDCPRRMQPKERPVVGNEKCVRRILRAYLVLCWSAIVKVFFLIKIVNCTTYKFHLTVRVVHNPQQNSSASQRRSFF